MDELINRIPVDDLRNTKIILFNANSPPEEHTTIDDIAKNYSDLVEEGILEVVNVGDHTEMTHTTKLAQYYGDPLDRVMWRSKEVLDFMCETVALLSNIFTVTQ